MLKVLPSMSIGPREPQTKDQELEAFFDRRKAFIEANNALVKAIDENSPFYPDKIYQALDALRIHTVGEAIDLQVDDKPFRSDWFDRGDSANQEMLKLVEAVSASIRVRLAALVIREGGVI
jgi:hypothetical protein